MTQKHLGFGLMRLPQNSANPTDIDIKQLEDMVDLFLDNGFTYFDTSYAYHNGESERAICTALVERHPRDSFTLANKYPTWTLQSEEDIEPLFAEQLDKCGVDHFDYYLLHLLMTPIYYNQVEPFHLFEHAKKWKEQGKIKHLGFSFHDNAELLDVILTEHPEVEFVQIVLNYYDMDSAFVESKACYDVIRKHGKKVVAMEPVKGGTLANVPEPAHTRMHEMDPGLSDASWAVRFAAEQDGVICALSGMSTLEQVQDNVSYMKDFQPLSDEEEACVGEATEAFKSQWKFLCSDWDAVDAACPKGVAISAIITAYNSLLIQPNPGFGAELNYFALITDRTCPVTACDHCGRCNEAARGELDVDAALHEAANFFIEHAFR